MGKPRFDWKSAVCQLAVQIEATRMTQRMFPERAARYDDLCRSRASYAAWLARSYGRYGRREVRA